jgi:uncharacterized protein YciI
MFVHYLLMYELADDYLERRAGFRSEHLKCAREAQERGELVLAGALADPVDRAMLLFECATPETVQLFAASDPYLIHGLVTGYQVPQWSTVVGDDACTPVKAA